MRALPTLYISAASAEISTCSQTALGGYSLPGSGGALTGEYCTLALHVVGLERQKPKGRMISANDWARLGNMNEAILVLPEQVA